MYFLNMFSTVLARRGVFLLGVLWGGVLLLGVQEGRVLAATPKSLPEIQSRVNEIERNIHLLSRHGLQLQQHKSQKLAKRLSDGQINFVHKDYSRASIIFFDIAESKEYRGQIGWFEAVYYLAESLYKKRYYLGARRYYEVLIKARSHFYEQALVRLLEIAEKTKNFKGMESYFQQMENISSSKVQATMLYLKAKWFYKQVRFAEARQTFLKVTPTSKYWFQAQHFLAVIALRTLPAPQKYRAAIRLFEGILQKQAQGATQRKIREYALLSLGRLYLETGDLQRSVDYYQRINRKSELFDQALYEVCWTYIRRAQKEKKAIKAKRQYTRALRALEILLELLGDSPFVPRARLLRGHLLLQLNKFNTAMSMYQKVVKRYSSVSEEMERLLQNRSNPQQYFESLIAQQQEKFDIGMLLPKLAVRWMKSEDMMGPILRILRDLKEGEKYIRQSNEIMQKLESALNLKDRLDLSPALKSGRIQGIAYQGELTTLLERLNNMQGELVVSKMNPQEREKYRQLRQRLKSVQLLFKETPQKKQELQQRNEQVLKRLEAMETRIHKVSVELKHAFRITRAVRSWLANDPQAKTLTPHERTVLENEGNQLQQMASRLREEYRNLRQKLSLARIRLGNVARSPHEDRIRKKYTYLLKEEENLLNAIRRRMSPEERRKSSEIQQIRRKIFRVQYKLKQFFLQMRQFIARRAQEIQKEIQREKINLTQYQSQLEKLKPQANQLAGRIALSSFLAVRQKFKKLILRADVGIIDVAWRHKEFIRSRIHRLTKERTSELRVLDTEFKDILQDVR